MDLKNSAFKSAEFYFYCNILSKTFKEFLLLLNFISENVPKSSLQVPFSFKPIPIGIEIKSPLFGNLIIAGLRLTPPPLVVFPTVVANPVLLAN